MKQFTINGKYLVYDWCDAIIERDEEGNKSIYSYVASVYKDPNGESWKE